MARSIEQQHSPKRLSWLPHPTLSLVLVLLWLALVNKFSMGDFAIGLLLALVIPMLTSHFWPSPPKIKSRVKFIKYFGLVIWDVVVANLQVARLILFVPNARMRSRWISIPLDLTAPEAITTLAATITMTPGTVSTDFSADGRTLLVHCLDCGDEAEAVAFIKQRYESRLKEIF